MEKKVSLAIIGAGEMGIIRGIIARAHPRYELKCLIEPNRIQARIVSRQLGVPCYPDYETARQRDSFDTVMICTPVDTHETIAEQVLKDKKHIFCEKPLSHGFESSYRMARLAEVTNAVHQVGYDQRFLPTFSRMKQLLQQGLLGQLLHVKAVAYKSEVIKPEGKKEADNRKQRWGLYGALGVHLLDMMLWYAGPLKTVSALTSRKFSRELDDFISVLCRFQNRVHGVVDISWSHHGYDNKPDFYLSLTGTNGTATVDRDHIEFYIKEAVGEFQPGENVIYASEIRAPAGFMLTQRGISWEMDAFADVILEGKDTVPDWWDGYRVAEFVEAIQRAATLGLCISLPLEMM